MNRLIIIGAGGFGKEAAWVGARMNTVRPRFEILGFCDDRLPVGATHAGHPVLGSIESAAARFGTDISFVCAVGGNAVRESLAARAVAVGWTPCEPLIDPSVIVAPGVVVGRGSYVGAGTVLSPDCRLGDHVLVNQHCTIGHDSSLDDFSQICPGARISGHVNLGRGAFVGSGAIVMQGASLGAGAVLGAGSFALKSIPAGATAVGNPARIILSSPSNS